MQQLGLELDRVTDSTESYNNAQRRGINLSKALQIAKKNDIDLNKLNSREIEELIRRDESLTRLRRAQSRLKRRGFIRDKELASATLLGVNLRKVNKSLKKISRTGALRKVAFGARFASIAVGNLLNSFGKLIATTVLFSTVQRALTLATKAQSDAQEAQSQKTADFKKTLGDLENVQVLEGSAKEIQKSADALSSFEVVLKRAGDLLAVVKNGLDGLSLRGQGGGGIAGTFDQATASSNRLTFAVGKQAEALERAGRIQAGLGTAAVFGGIGLFGGVKVAAIAAGVGFVVGAIAAGDATISGLVESIKDYGKELRAAVDGAANRAEALGDALDNLEIGKPQITEKDLIQGFDIASELGDLLSLIHI